MNEYKKIRFKYLSKSENRFCKARIPGICLGTRVQGIELDIHHKKGKIGDLLTNTKYFLPVCRACHQFIHDNPEIAKDLGFMEDRLTIENDEEI